MSQEVYDQEKDPRGPLSWWSVSVDELAAGWRWPPRWAADLPEYLAAVLAKHMREGYDTAVLNGPALWTASRKPWWHWRTLLRGWRRG